VWRRMVDHRSVTRPIAARAVVVVVGLSVSPPPQARQPAAPARVLTLGETSTLRVGEFAVLQIPADRRYSHSGIGGAWGDVLRRVRRSKRDVVFRAMRPGQGVIIISPEVSAGDCISCATRH
jgi:hypothetical protein